jgi:DNA gyrase/topoisomerase IV subunit A
VDPRERLAILELLLVAAERRREVVDAVWNSADDGEARARLRELLGIQGDLLPQVILDQQVRLMTREKREAIATEINQVRALAEGSPGDTP